MARRNKSTVLEDIIVIVSKLPWWIGVVLALISYFYLHHVATQTVAIATSPTNINSVLDASVSQAWKAIAGIFQYLLPFSFLIGAAISAYKNTKRDKPKQQSNTANWNSSPQPQTTPTCPQCGASMIRRTAKKGNRTGETFWGCSNYPGCRETIAS
jgi:restriction system protein